MSTFKIEPKTLPIAIVIGAVFIIGIGAWVAISFSNIDYFLLSLAIGVILIVSAMGLWYWERYTYWQHRRYHI